MLSVKEDEDDFMKEGEDTFIKGVKMSSLRRVQMHSIRRICVRLYPGFLKLRIFCLDKVSHEHGTL